MAQQILIVDEDEAFATLLKEGVEQTREYKATIVYDGSQALRVAGRTAFDLAIVDMGVSQPTGAELVVRLRESCPTLRLMLIPLNGEEMPEGLGDLQIQGLLPKPFFFPELPGRVADALAAPMALPELAPVVEAPDPPLAAVAAPAPSPVPAASFVASPVAAVRWNTLQERSPLVLDHMKRLVQDVGADCALLTNGDQMVAHAGRLSADEARALSQAVTDSWRTSACVARILGKEQLRFEQSLEGGEYLFYSLAVADCLILSVVLQSNTPLGIIRHRAKATAENLKALA